MAILHDTHIEFSDGSTFSVKSGLIGLSADLDVSQGHTSMLDCIEYYSSVYYDNLSDEHRIELANLMIELWQQYRAKFVGGAA